MVKKNFPDRGFARIGLIIRHPQQALDDLTNLLGLQPHRVWQVGGARTTPKGKTIGGVWQDSAWLSDQEVSFDTTDAAIKNYICRLQDAFERILDITNTGGRAVLVFRMSGSENYGFVLSPDQLRELAQLGVEVSVEVFP
jgi:hypothetical protein